MSFNSQHWYGRDGSSAYGSTLRDARKVGLVPSVTTIDKVIAAPQLTDWMVQQALDAALTLPRMDGESLDAFKVRALDDSRRQAREAAEKGSELHNALEASIKGARIVGPFKTHAANVAVALKEHFGEQPWVAEASFAHPLGFGGKCDLHAPSFVVDFKSKPRIEDGKKYGYDNHVRQLAAYAVGFGMVAESVQDNEPGQAGGDWEHLTLANLFVGIEDAKVAVHIWKPAQAVKGWQQFRAALSLWKALNNFDSAFLREAA